MRGRQTMNPFALPSKLPCSSKMTKFTSNHHQPRLPSIRVHHSRRRLHFETLESRRLLTLDFGDAPSPYPVTLLEDGARHNTDTWQRLGPAIDGQPGDYSGDSVSLNSDGTRLIVGSEGNALARVYEQDGVQWSQLGNDLVGHGVFGRVTSINAAGDIVAVGSPYSGMGGRVKVYQFDGSNWNQLGAEINGEQWGDQAGSAISLSANGLTIAVGAAWNDGNGNAAGNTRVHQWNGSQWVQLGADIDGEAADDRSGQAVSLNASGNTIAIGAPDNDGNGSNSGHVRVYRSNGSQWTQLGTDIDGEAAGDRSGGAVSLSADGNTLAIGSAWNNDNGNSAGHTRVYRWNGSQWVQLGADIDGELANGLSGTSVSLSADSSRLAIGAPWGAGTGQTRVYHFHNTNSIPLGTTIVGETVDENFGESTSLSGDGNRLAVGSPFKGLVPGDDNNVTGSASVFSMVDQSLRLGGLRDAEADGTPSNFADGDGEDEDGITYSALIAGTTANIDVSVAGRAGQLDAWIDFNADGDWQDAGEQIYSSEPVSVGVNSLSFAVPNDAIGGGSGTTFARFRLSTHGGLTVTGASPDGEVEDYQMVINAAPTLNSIPDPPKIRIDAGQQVVTLSGITAGGVESQPLKVEVASSNDAITGTPTVAYVSPSSAATLSFSPTRAEIGIATLTVTVTDGGLDQNLATPDDNAVTQQTFQVEVIQREDPWTNSSSVFDVNFSNSTSLLDALLLVNLSNRFPQYSFGLPDLSQKAGEDINGDGISDPYLGNFYPDVNGDNKATLGDALSIINRIHQIANSQQAASEGENVARDVPFTSAPENLIQLDTATRSVVASAIRLPWNTMEPRRETSLQTMAINSALNATQSEPKDTKLIGLLAHAAERRPYCISEPEVREHAEQTWDLALTSFTEANWLRFDANSESSLAQTNHPDTRDR